MTAILAFRAMDEPASLGVQFGACDAGLCITWVMPVARAWQAGARRGDPVVSVDGQAVTETSQSALPKTAERQFSWRDRGGRIISVEKPQSRPAGSAAFFLWAIAGLIAVLGAIVLLRRPDLYSARMFGVFAACSAISLSVGPAAGGTQLPLPLIFQFLSLVALGAAFPILSLALIEREEARSRPVLLFASLGSIALTSIYILSVLRFADWYGGVRLALAVWVGFSVSASVAVLAILGTRQTSRRRKQAWIVLTGFGLGTFPFVVLSHVPISLGLPYISGYVTVRFVVLIPIAFAIAILQYEMLGIRRLIHRGMVYGVTSAILLAAVALGVGALGKTAEEGSIWPLALIAVVGAAVYHPLRIGVHRLIDRFVYRDVVDYGEVIDTVRTDLAQVEQAHGVAGTLIRRVVDSLQLESALLYLGQEQNGAVLTASFGRHAAQVSSRIQALPHSRTRGGHAVEFSWESNSLLLSPLSRSGGYLGHVLWGPKRGGEVFVADERRVIDAMTPILTLALEEQALSNRLRDLNKRLLEAEEAERRRIAQDLHDGPLQKAVVLGGFAEDRSPEERKDLAQQLAGELREVCARLRPSILDDLGLVSALDWLLVEAGRHSKLEAHLRLGNVDEDQRFSPDVELALFRVTQESINNVVKHAKATTIDISLKVEGDELMLRVKDDGVGFRQTQRNGSGLGLPGMSERIFQINGRFEVRSEPGQGTELLARVPIPRQEGGDGLAD